ncbi:MAG: spore coat U domain-containing protein [Thermodesulfobacteriota bacterium]
MGKTTRKILSIVSIFGFLWVTAGYAYAATATGTLNVSATVISNCRVKSVTNIGFGNYDPTDVVTPTDAAGDFTFKCTKNTAYDLYVTGTRTMTDGVDILSYELYTDAPRTTLWPSASPGVTGTSTSNADDLRNVYGRIAAGQDVGAGAYSGTVTVTVQY